MNKIAIDDPRFDALLERVVAALLALDGSTRPKPKRVRRTDALLTAQVSPAA
jgi:hypothetical protein